MDKETLSNYGWIVICVLVLSVMIALATPFGSFISDAVQNTTEGLFKTEQSALEKGLKASGIELENATFGDVNTVGGSDDTTKTLPAKGKTLEEYTWAEVQQIIQAGKATEYGFVVGGTKTLSINDATKTATIIGLNHDGENTATFMILSSGGIGQYAMNDSMYNLTGWQGSKMREWLNTTIYEGMVDTKEYIKEVSKLTDNTGKGNTSTTNDKIFLLSANEVDMANQDADRSKYLETEGTAYAWFNKGKSINNYFWLRTPVTNESFCFYNYYYADLNNDKVSEGNLFFNAANEVHTVCPAFVIG